MSNILFCNFIQRLEWVTMSLIGAANSTGNLIAKFLYVIHRKCFGVNLLDHKTRGHHRILHFISYASLSRLLMSTSTKHQIRNRQHWPTVIWNERDLCDAPCSSCALSTCIQRARFVLFTLQNVLIPKLIHSIFNRKGEHSQIPL